MRRNDADSAFAFNNDKEHCVNCVNLSDDIEGEGERPAYESPKTITGSGLGAAKTESENFSMISSVENGFFTTSY